MRVWNRMKRHFCYSHHDLLVTLGLMAAAALVSAVLLHWGGEDFNVTPVFILAIALIARNTDGYLWGMLASVASVFIVNTYFTYPLGEINFMITGYPVTFMVMLAVALLTGLSTNQLRDEMTRARTSEQQAHELLQRNQRLARERESIRVEAEKEKLRGDLLRAISHDLRTPLTAILGASSAMLDGGERLDVAEREKLLRGIGDDAQWLIRMVENLLSVTRISGGETQIVKSQEIAEEIMAEAVGKIRQRYPGQTVRVSAPDELLIVPMDGMLIEQVIINLIENALLHSGSTQPARLTARREGNAALFEVRDSGRGIDPADLPHLFEGFSRSGRGGDSSRSMGIGLSVCLSIVRAHGGDMTAFNAPEGGAVFRFTLPLEEEENHG